MWGVNSDIWILIIALLCSAILILLVAVIVLACQLHKRYAEKQKGRYDVKSLSSANGDVTFDHHGSTTTDLSLDWQTKYIDAYDKVELGGGAP